MATKDESRAVAKVEDNVIALSATTVSAYVNPYATKSEIALFLNQCAMFGLNPFKREIYLIKYSPKDPATFVVGYEAYLKRAERSGKWAGLESGTEGEGGAMKAFAKVFRKDWSMPLTHVVEWSEYAQYKDERVQDQRGQWVKTGKKVLTRFWAEKPKTMLKKVAIAQALRMAFPDETGGMPFIAEELNVDHERMERGETEPPNPVVEPAATGAASGTAETAGSPKVVYKVGAPLKDIKDEFTDIPNGDADPLDERETAEDHPARTDAAAPPLIPAEPERPTMAQMERFAKIKADLAVFGIDEEFMWRGIHKFTRNTFGRTFTDSNDMTSIEMDQVVGYLHRWKKAEESKRAEAANGANKKKA